jgi:hypothetical protein
MKTLSISTEKYVGISMVLLLVALIPFLQVQMVAATTRSDESSNDESSNDESSNDESSNDQQDSGPSLTDKICHALNSGAGAALIPLLHAAGIATGGTVNTAIIAAQGYCAIHGG